MCFEAVGMLISLLGQGYNMYASETAAKQQGKALKSQAELGAQSLLQQKEYNQGLLDMQNNQFNQMFSTMEGANGVLGTAPVSGSGTAGIASTGGTESSLVPGASEILKTNTNNVYSWQ